MKTNLRASRIRAANCDSMQRKYTMERLDSYAAAMQFDPVKTPEEIILEQEAYTRLIQRIDALPPRIGLCIKLRQGIGCEPHTLKQVGERYGLSRGRVQQIEAKGYRILKRWIWIEEKPQRWRQERENLKKIEREREASKELDRELNRSKQQAWKEAQDREYAERNEEFLKEQQRSWMALRRAAEYDADYREAHAINALWPSELERRAQEQRNQLANQKRREEFEQRVQVNQRRREEFKQRVQANQKRREEFEVRLRKYVDKRNAWFDGPIKRDWLLVATEGVS